MSSSAPVRSIAEHPPRSMAMRALAALAAIATLVTIATSGPTAQAADRSAGGYTTRASSVEVRPGDSVTVEAFVEGDSDGRALVDVEFYVGSQKVYQKYWDDQRFEAGRTRRFSTTVSIPQGTPQTEVTVKIGVFGPRWSGLRHWNDRAGTVTVLARATEPADRGTTTTVATPPTTAPPTTAPPTTAPPTTAPPTTAPPTTAPPTTAPPTTAPPTTAPPAPNGRFETLPVGATLPSGAACAERVRPAAEIRPENAAENARRGSRANANTRTDWAGFSRVDGAFAGTTDEIIQWAACKWGVDEDLVRAQVVKESWWYMSANGDNGESWGLGQVRVPYHQSAFQFGVNARNSSAYNLDYTYANWRACYEGALTWLNNVERGATYGPGDAFGCTGVWFSGRWYTADAIRYIEGGETNGYGTRGVKQHLALRTWEDPNFING